MSVLFMFICAISLLFFTVFLLQCSRAQRRPRRASPTVVKLGTTEAVDSVAGRRTLIYLEQQMAEFLSSHSRGIAALLLAVGLIGVGHADESAKHRRAGVRGKCRSADFGRKRFRSADPTGSSAAVGCHAEAHCDAGGGAEQSGSARLAAAANQRSHCNFRYALFHRKSWRSVQGLGHFIDLRLHAQAVHYVSL